MPGITKDEFEQRRKTLASKLSPKSIVIIPAYPWQQNNNLLYLCGFDEPDSALLLGSSETTSKGSESSGTLFLRGNDDHSLLWSGPQCSPEQVRKHFGIQMSRPFDELDQVIPVGSRNVDYSVYTDKELANTCLNDALKGYLEDERVGCVRHILDRMRLVKSEAEQKLMRQSGSIASESFAETIRWARRTRKESNLAAKMEFECKIRGATGLAYVPVVAGGDRANTIHYVRNDRLIRDDDLVLMDAGAKVHGYCSDITRTFPISGRFSTPQRELYEAVLRVQKQCIYMLSQWPRHPRPPSLNDLNLAAVHLFVEELGIMGFKRPEKVVDLLFPHSLGHYLGMDLHDCQSVSYNEPLLPGMVITIEPGLYVPAHPAHPDFPVKYHGIGIRIEDDILVTPDGCQVLTKAVPKEVEEIERLMLAN